MEKYQKILKENAFLDNLKNEFSGSCYPSLTGGAINDILSDVVPKDYDFVHTVSLENEIYKNPNFKFLYISRTAITFEYKTKIIQLLYKNPKDYPYTIEQAEFDIRRGNLKNFDITPYESKTLIPNQECFKKIPLAKNAVRRLLKWYAKGFEIPQITYQSMLKVAFKADPLAGLSKANLKELIDEDDES